MTSLDDRPDVLFWIKQGADGLRVDVCDQTVTVMVPADDHPIDVLGRWRLSHPVEAAHVRSRVPFVRRLGEAIEASARGDEVAALRRRVRVLAAWNGVLSVAAVFLGLEIFDVVDVF